MRWIVKMKWIQNGRAASFDVIGPQTESELRESMARTHSKLEIVSVEPAAPAAATGAEAGK